MNPRSVVFRAGGEWGPGRAIIAGEVTTIGAAPSYATSAKGILCESDTQLNKTGALMVAAPEPSNSSAPQNVTVTMKGEGYQAIFLGVLL